MSIDSLVVAGVAVIDLYDKNNDLIMRQIVKNLVTTAGDQYYAKKAITGIAPAAPAAPTPASGMKLGSGATAVGKSAAGAANLGAYIAASNNPFDGGFPTAEVVLGDTGWTATYKTSWAAGDVTAASITEAVIVNDAAADATSSIANTYSRITFTAVNKTADDSLVITWKHKFLGA